MNPNNLTAKKALKDINYNIQETRCNMSLQQMEESIEE